MGNGNCNTKGNGNCNTDGNWKDEIYARLEGLESYIAGEVERKILKEYEKLQKGNEGDITKVNLESIFKDYALVKNPSEELKAAFNALKELYDRTY